MNEEEKYVDESNCNGRIGIRTKKSLHEKLLKISKEEKVSVSHLINDAIMKVYG
jgi:predicted HicB family RNase H-like nuclease